MKFNWPEIQENYKDNIYESYQIPDGCDVDNLEELLNCHVLKHCGCGNNKANLFLVYNLLKIHKNARKNDYNNYEKYQDELKKYISSHINEVLRFIWYTLDALTLMEHGGCVPGRLTEDGEEFFILLEKYFNTKTEEEENENN